MTELKTIQVDTTSDEEVPVDVVEEKPQDLLVESPDDQNEEVNNDVNKNPEWWNNVPDKFINEQGEPDYEKIFKSQQEAEKKVGEKQEQPITDDELTTVLKEHNPDDPVEVTEELQSYLKDHNLTKDQVKAFLPILDNLMTPPDQAAYQKEQDDMLKTHWGDSYQDNVDAIESFVQDLSPITIAMIKSNAELMNAMNDYRMSVKSTKMEHKSSPSSEVSRNDLAKVMSEGNDDEYWDLMEKRLREQGHNF